MKRQETLRHQNGRDNKSKSCEFTGKVDVWKFLKWEVLGMLNGHSRMGKFQRGSGANILFLFHN